MLRVVLHIGKQNRKYLRDKQETERWKRKFSNVSERQLQDESPACLSPFNSIVGSFDGFDGSSFCLSQWPLLLFKHLLCSLHRERIRGD